MVKAVSKWFVACALVGLGGAVALWWLTQSEADRPPPTEALPASVVLRIKPQASAASRSSSGIAAKQPLYPRSEALEQLASGRDLAGLYQRMRAGPRTAESLYVQAEIYSRCARRMRAPTSAAQRREKFVATLLPADPTAQEKLAAFDRLNTNPCKGLEELGEFSQEILNGLLSAAASAGDPRAAAALLAQKIEGRYNAVQPRPPGYEVSDDEFASILRVLQSRDPEAVQHLQGVLSSSWDQAALLLNGRPVEPRAMHAALGLLACDLGANCGADSGELLAHCAYRGECSVSNLQDYTFFYVASPAQAQQIDSYRQELLRMLRQGSLGGLTVQRGAANSSSFVFGGRRRR